MLYVSTRNRVDSYTAYRALHEDRTPDGGFFVPYRLPVFSNSDIAELTEKCFGERVARILNVFFPVGLSGWDVDFAIGRHPYKLLTMNHRLYIAELWHNLESNFCFIEACMYRKLCENDGRSTTPTTWAKIAIRIAVLCGICCELSRQGVTSVDMAGITGDYLFVIAALYAGRMGLPVGRIICTGDENSGIWDLLYKGDLPTNADTCRTDLPLLDSACPPTIEILLYSLLGVDKVEVFLNAQKNRRSLRLDSEDLSLLNRCMEGAVISRERCASLVRSIYRTHNYVPDPYMAIAYGGLLDYRSRTGESGAALLFSEFSPMTFEPFISETVGVSPAELRRIISNG